MRFILLFCLIAIWKVPSEWLPANSVNFQCRYFENLPPSLLSLQQVPREPCWTRAGVSGSISWQEPRPFLLVVNKGQSALPPLQAPVRWLLQRAGPAPVQFPAARPRCWRPVSVNLTHLRVEEGWSSRRCGTWRRHTRARPAEVASSVSAWLLAFLLLVFRNRSAQVSFGHSCLLVLLAPSASLLGPELSSPRSHQLHPGPAILGLCFSLLSTTSLLLSKHSAPSPSWRRCL